MKWDHLWRQLERAGLGRWAAQLEELSAGWLIGHGDYPRWSAALANLPEIRQINADFTAPAVTLAGQCEDNGALRAALEGLMPWRKGPYRFVDVLIDSEWRSDLKWARVLAHLAPLRGRRILDIGCGNGYYCWRMLAEAPALVVGIEPSVLFNLQFQAVQHYLQRPDIGLLPIGVEAIPDDLGCFETVFSMGVLYHRRSPIDHLQQLRGLLAPGGELCLETLVIEGGAGRVLVPQDRYARMRNVWFIPSSAEILNWLARCGFVDSRVVDESLTTKDEQRTTPWMQFESLEQSLDPKRPELTVEGLPAPRRAVILANRPQA